MKYNTAILSGCVAFFLVVVSVIGVEPNPALSQLSKEIAGKKAKEQQIKDAIESLKDDLSEVTVQREVAEKKRAELYPESIAPPAPASLVEALSTAIQREHLRRGLKIRRSIYEETAIEKPASIQFVAPGTGDDSYAIDVGATFSLVPLDHPTFPHDHFYVGMTAEYHRNTQNQAESDSFLSGLTVIEIIGNASKGVAHHLQAAALYKNDRLHTDQGFIGGITYTPLVPKFGIGVTNMKSPLIGYVWQPTAGVQFEYGDDVEMTGVSGETFRGKLGIDLALYPFHETLKQRLELIAGYQFWINLGQSGGFEIREDDYCLTTFSVNWYLDKEKHFALGLDYLEGDNPQEAFFDDEYWRLSLKVKY